MGNENERMSIHRYVEQAYAGYWLAQKGKDKELAEIGLDQYSLPVNPVESTALRLRKTNLRNEVTSPLLSILLRRYQPHVNRRKDNPRSKGPGVMPEDRLTWVQ